MLIKTVLSVLLLSLILFISDAQIIQKPSLNNIKFSNSGNSGIIGKWTATSIAGYKTNFDIQFTKNTIHLKYCNSMSFSYSTNGNNINIEGGASTKMMCYKNNPTQSEISATLRNAQTFDISGRTLTLKNGQNKVIATFKNEGNDNLVKPGRPIKPINPITRPSKPATSIIGKWTTTIVKNIPVSFAVTITQNTIHYRYCNSVTRDYTINGNTINIKHGISTKMACIGQNPDQNTVSAAFSDAKTFKLNGNILTFFDNNGNALVTLYAGFASIVGNYTIVSINNVATLQLQKVAVSIDDKNISFKYCNGKNFAYTTDKNNISIQQGMSTLMYCEGLNPSQSEVSTAFASAKTYEIDGKLLRLFDATGKTRVTLSKK